MKRYICLGDYVRSKTDGQIHYITAQRVRSLYQVNPDECLFVELHQGLDSINRHNEKLILLTPRMNGDYQEYLEKLNDNS